MLGPTPTVSAAYWGLDVAAKGDALTIVFAIGSEVSTFRIGDDDTIVLAQ